MTAPEPTPAAEHVDAVARVVHRFVESHDRDEMVADLLTSTDPAVHAAMLDALVRAGVLKRSTQRGTLISSGSILELDRGGKVHERFASDWREVAP